MEYLKDKKLITPEYVAKLKEYIIAHPKDMFAKENEADSWQDFVRFPTMKTDREHLCLPTEPFLVDRSIETRVGGEHWYCICTISENGRVGMETPVIAISELYPHGWRNGYFLLPIL